MIIRSLAPDVYKSAELLKATADAVNEAAAKVKAHAMRVGYHNHFADFNRIGGEYWWNRFADQTTKDVVLQLDTGNASELAGVEPCRSHPAQRRPHRHDAREAVLEGEAPTPTSAPTSSTGRGS